MYLNIAIFRYFYGLSGITFIKDLALFLSYPFVWIVIFLIFAWILFFNRRKMYYFSLFFLSGFVSWIISVILKNIWKIPRPFATMHLTPLHSEVGYSFPSGHATFFAALAVSMFLVDKKAGIIFSIIAILVGLSRIVIGVHYPTDVLAGLAVGALVGLIFNKVFKKI